MLKNLNLDSPIPRKRTPQAQSTARWYLDIAGLPTTVGGGTRGGAGLVPAGPVTLELGAAAGAGCR